MNCPSCSAHNPDSHRFCSECGHALPRLCGACGFGNSAGAKFCGGCGTSLQTEAPQPEPQPAAPPAQAAPPALESEAERRQLTVMFCDLVGSTALSEGLDLEDLRDVLRRYQDAAAEHITAQDGFIARYMGDGLLVYFGYPQAHENDAERAIRAGLDIARDVGQMTLDDGRMLSVRIGIATGQVVVGDIVGHGAAEE
ncbi:MAG: adenylate/guanylate cyclase domain-containing protein, partial [Rhodospirillales bacterium]|nr:adenylate/guanylate cyclase domain-containing protein [Rhodospirillales bacterium]